VGCTGGRGGYGRVATVGCLFRQEILHHPGRSFEFLLTEAALRYRRGSREVLTAQLDHLADVVTLETITFGIIPSGAGLHAVTRCGFVISLPCSRIGASRFTGGDARRATASVSGATGAGTSGAIPGQLGTGKREDAGCGRPGGGHGAALNTARKSW
jgi:Domain of unknown function (DUF5753)